MVWLCDGILLSCKKERTIDTCIIWINLKETMLNKTIHTKKTIWFHLYRILENANIIFIALKKNDVSWEHRVRTGRDWLQKSRRKLWEMKDVCIIFFFFLAMPPSSWDLSFLIRDWTQALGSERAEL